MAFPVSPYAPLEAVESVVLFYVILNMAPLS